MTDQHKQNVKQFGVANIITIIIVLSGLVANYTMMSSKVGYISERLEEEVSERKIGDNRVREDIFGFYTIQTQQLEIILNELSGIREDLTFHLGKHAGEEVQER